MRYICISLNNRSVYLKALRCLPDFSRRCVHQPIRMSPMVNVRILMVGLQRGLTLRTPFDKLDESDPGLPTWLCSRVYSNLG